MSTEVLEQEMQKYFTLLSEAEKISVLQMIKTFAERNDEEPMSDDDDARRISIEQYNREIDEAMKRMDAGEFHTHEEVVEMSKSWVNGK